MSIINQSVTPNGRRCPAFHSKGSASQDASQHLPIPQPYDGTRSLRSTQPSLLRRNSLTVANGGSPQAQLGSLHQVSSGSLEKERQDDRAMDGICNLSYLFSEEHCSGHLNQSHVISVAHDDKSNTTIGGMLLEPFTSTFRCSLLDNDKLNLINDLLGGAASTNDVLAVAVSSAVKLDSKQIDLIARKMQRLTGFRNLRMKNILDPSLIAGFVITYDSDGSNTIDLSVKGQLNALAARIESSDQRNSNDGHSW